MRHSNLEVTMSAEEILELLPAKERAEVFSHDNRWFAGEKLKRPATMQELVEHYIKATNHAPVFHIMQFTVYSN